MKKPKEIIDARQLRAIQRFIEDVNGYDCIVEIIPHEEVCEVIVYKPVKEEVYAYKDINCILKSQGA